MENETVTTGGGPNENPGVLTEKQRATFRSAGLWMAIIGWAELLFGAVSGLVWLLGALGVASNEVRLAPSEGSFLVLQVVGSIVIGGLTLIAARSFRRAGREADAGLPTVTAAVADLAELYERQVWVGFALLLIVIGGALAKW
ncbi:MAG: hypothetical protein U0793_01685 [Gemmataceae bacterium]